MSSTGHFDPIFLGSVFFRIALPCSGDYHLERGGMKLHDAVGILLLLLLKEVGNARLGESD